MISVCGRQRPVLGPHSSRPTLLLPIRLWRHHPHSPPGRGTSPPPGEGNAQIAQSWETLFWGLHTQGIYDLAPQREEEAEGKEAKAWARGNKEEERAQGFSPLASPRGLKEAVGVTVLVESMKLREAQKIPERTLLSSFQDVSTLDGDTNPPLSQSSLCSCSKACVGCYTIRPAG